MADDLFRLTVQEVVNYLKDVLQLAGLINRKTRPQESEENNNHQRDQNFHRYEVCPWTLGIFGVHPDKSKKRFCRCGEVVVQQLREPELMMSHRSVRK